MRICGTNKGMQIMWEEHIEQWKAEGDEGGGGAGQCSHGSKNQKFEFRSRLQLRRIDVHINQQRTAVHTQDCTGRRQLASVGAGTQPARQPASQLVTQSVSQMWFSYCCCVEFCKSSGNATKKEAKKIRKRKPNRSLERRGMIHI